MPASRLCPGDPPAVGPYLLLGRVATGGMGVVYLGREDGRPDSLVAVKTVRPDSAAPGHLVERLRTEARLSAELAAVGVSAPTLARFVGADAEAERPWIATEYVPGPSLHDAADGRGMGGHDVMTVGLGLARCLSALHLAGYAHRDVKPANVVVGPDGPRLVDLGLARAVGSPNELLLMGSPGWSPPERHDSRRDARPRDVHGWGMCVAYAASGRPPFGRGPAEVVTRRMLVEPPLLDGLPDPLRGLVARTLDPDPARRPAADEVVDALARIPLPITTPTLAATSASARPTSAMVPASAAGPGSRTQRLASPTLVEDVAPAAGSATRRLRRAGARPLVAAAACAAVAVGVLALGRSTTGPVTSAAAAPAPRASAPSPTAVARTSPAPAPTRATVAASTAALPRSPAPHHRGKHHKRRH